MPSVPRRFRCLSRVHLLGLHVPVATSIPSRLLGLAFLPRERAGSGLLIPASRSVHTFGMRFRLDLIFLDDERRVLAVRREVGACRVVRCAGAAAVLELPSPEPTGGEPRRQPA